MVAKSKTGKQLERHFKGVANHHRIEILLKISECSGMSVEEIAVAQRANFKTISEHTRRLVQAGLINKQYVGRRVVHSLTPYGSTFVAFIRTFQHS